MFFTAAQRGEGIIDTFVSEVNDAFLGVLGGYPDDHSAVLLAVADARR